MFYILFLKYYGYEFEYEKYGFSLNDNNFGNIFNKDERTDMECSKTICVESIIEHGIDVGKSCFNYEKIVNLFKAAYNKIKLEIENNYDKITEEPIRKAIKNHFRFLYWKERKKISKVIFKFVWLSVLGIALMAFYYQHIRFIGKFDAVPTYSKIIIEGINIAGWVAFWEAFTCLIFGFIPIVKNKKIYESISKAGIRVGKL